MAETFHYKLSIVRKLAINEHALFSCGLFYQPGHFRLDENNAVHLYMLLALKL